MNPETGTHHALTVYPNFILFISVYMVCFHFKFAHWSIGVCIFTYRLSYYTLRKSLFFARYKQ